MGGKRWFGASIYSVKSKQSKDLLIKYDDYSNGFNFWCSRNSKRIRPTIGFLRKKIMVPQAEKIKSLQRENEKLKEENMKLKDKYNEQEYEYLALKKMTASNENVDGDNSDDIKKRLNIKDLVRIQTMIEKRIEIQQRRLDSSQNDIILPVMNQKFVIDDKINKYEQELKSLQLTNSETLQKYEIIKNDIDQLRDSLYDLHSYCNQKIIETNNLHEKNLDINKKVNKYECDINEYKDYSSSFFDLLKGFQKFQVLNQEHISNSSTKINAAWKVIESSWYQWESDDILLWIQHKMNWMNKNAMPHYLDLDVILEKMAEKNMNGKSLATLKKNDLSYIGFSIHSHRTLIYQFIQSLITKNPILNDEATEIEQIDDNLNEDGHDNTNDVYSDHDKEGNVETVDVDIEIPEKYKCALLNRLMSEPVICGHNNKVFEKSAIYQYINENGKVPFDSSKNQINLNDDSSFLLFDLVSLKIEIEQFKQERGL